MGKPKLSLSEERAVKLMDWLAEKGIEFKCVICGYTDFQAQTKIYPNELRKTPEAILELRCSQCGHVLYFDHEILPS